MSQNSRKPASRSKSPIPGKRRGRSAVKNTEKRGKTGGQKSGSAASRSGKFVLSKLTYLQAPAQTPSAAAGATANQSRRMGTVIRKRWRKGRRTIASIQNHSSTKTKAKAEPKGTTRKRTKREARANLRQPGSRGRAGLNLWVRNRCRRGRSRCFLSSTNPKKLNTIMKFQVSWGLMIIVWRQSSPCT